MGSQLWALFPGSGGTKPRDPGRSPRVLLPEKLWAEGVQEERNPVRLVLTSLPQLQGKSTDATNTPACLVLSVINKNRLYINRNGALSVQDQNFTKISAGCHLSLHEIFYKIKIQACGWQSLLVCLPPILSPFLFSLIQTKKSAHYMSVSFSCLLTSPLSLDVLVLHEFFSVCNQLIISYIFSR